MKYERRISGDLYHKVYDEEERIEARKYPVVSVIEVVQDAKHEYGVYKSKKQLPVHIYVNDEYKATYDIHSSMIWYKFGVLPVDIDIHGKDELTIYAKNVSYVYKYTDVDTNEICYIGIVSSDKRTLSRRVYEHSKELKFTMRNWSIDYIECNSQCEAEAWEGHLIAKYKPTFNKAKTKWGINRYLPNDEFLWKHYATESYDSKEAYVNFDWKYWVAKFNTNAIVRNDDVLFDGENIAYSEGYFSELNFSWDNDTHALKDVVWSYGTYDNVRILDNGQYEYDYSSTEHNYFTYMNELLTEYTNAQIKDDKNDIGYYQRRIKRFKKTFTHHLNDLYKSGKITILN